MKDGLFPVALLAGGRGTRLGAMTESAPKSLVEAGGEPFIAHQLRLLRSRGVEKVVVCLGHLGESVRTAAGSGSAFGLRLEYSFDGRRPLGTAGAVKKALRRLGDEFFVMYGDSYLPCSFREVRAAYRRSGRPALMTVFRNDGRWGRSNVAYENGRIRAYDKESPSAGMRHIDYGLGVFHRDVFRFVPRGRFFDLAVLYRTLIERGELAAHKVGERFYEVGSPAGLAAFREFLSGAVLGTKESS